MAKIRNLEGKSLKWAVAKCQGYELWSLGGWNAAWTMSLSSKSGTKEGSFLNNYHPDTDWVVAGPIIQSERISIETKIEGWWQACVYDAEEKPQHVQMARSPLVAAMRCYVDTRYGFAMEVPQGITTYESCEVAFA